MAAIYRAVKIPSGWAVRSPNGRRIARCTGYGSAQKVAAALNLYDQERKEKKNDG